MYLYLSGWQWEAKDRPTFKDIHNALENMFEKSSISEGKLSLYDLNMFYPKTIYMYFIMFVIYFFK